MISGIRVLAACGAAIGAMAIADAASAACTRLAFSVNDYGKVGPTNDAKNLLDKYIAKWAAERNIKGYNVGKKDVTCELFLDLIVFDEYTCKAAATVCWNGPLPPGHKVDASATPSVNQAAQKRAGGTAPIATGSVKAAPAPKSAAPVATPAAAPPKAPAATPAKAAAPAAPAPAAAPAAPPAPAAN